jgi:hypothetical protein
MLASGINMPVAGLLLSTMQSDMNEERLARFEIPENGALHKQKVQRRLNY